MLILLLFMPTSADTAVQVHCFVFMTKTESVRQIITFMGLELDYVTIEARLPLEK